MSLARGILLGDAAKRSPIARIYVPRGHEDGPPIGHCLVPGCGRKFYRGQEAEWQDHVARCAKRNLDEIRALAPSHAKRGTIFDPADEDRELQRHFREVAERMRREGRTETYPHERAPNA